MFNIDKRERQFRYAGYLTKSLAVLAVAFSLSNTVANADDQDINSILGNAPSINQNLSQPQKGLKNGLKNGQKEVWVKGKKPIDHLHIIGAHPLPGENCQQVIFDARPSVKSRHEARSKTAVSFDISRLCLLGLRNGSDKKAFVIRLGEAFETLAISPDPDLFTGMVVEPHQQIMIPVRPLPVGILKVPLEVTWKSDLNKDNPSINKTTITINGKK